MKEVQISLIRQILDCLPDLNEACWEHDEEVACRIYDKIQELADELSDTIDGEEDNEGLA